MLIVAMACAGSLLLSGCLSTTPLKHVPGVSPLIPGATVGEFLSRAELGYGTYVHFVWVPYLKHHLDKQHSVDVSEAATAAQYVYEQLQLAGSLAASSGHLARTYGQLTTLALFLGHLPHQIRKGKLVEIPVIEQMFQRLRQLSYAGGVTINERVDDSFAHQPKHHSTSHKKPSYTYPPAVPLGP